MLKKQREQILERIKDIPDDKLEDMYYDAVMDTLGSVAETMWERGYDPVDIKDQLKHEKYQGEYAKILETECLKRGIKIWEGLCGE